MPTTSTMVAIKGPLIRAGSSLSFRDIIGKAAPITAANITVIPIAMPTEKLKRQLLSSWIKTLTSPTIAKIAPIDTPSKASLHTTLKKSLTFISPVVKDLITIIADWVPALPPVAIKIGKKNVSDIHFSIKPP